MKFFNYETIYMAAHGNPDKMMELFITTNTIGVNFLVNPRGLANSFWVSNRHKAEYLGFCSLRAYEKYLTSGEVNLSLADLPPWVPIAIAKDNPLLTVTNTQIIFNKEK